MQCICTQRIVVPHAPIFSLLQTGVETGTEKERNKETKEREKEMDYTKIREKATEKKPFRFHQSLAKARLTVHLNTEKGIKKQI